MKAGFAAILCTLAACASVPDFEEERAHVVWQTPPLCAIQAAPPTVVEPEVLRIASDELSKRGVACTPEMVAEGSRVLVNQLQHERQVAQAVEQQNRETASRTADKMLQILMAVGAGYAMAQAMQPSPAPPPGPVQCHTSYGYRSANTTCY